MNSKLARISTPTEEAESLRKYVDNVIRTNRPIEMAEWVRDTERDNAAYVVIDGETMLAEYIVFEGKIFEPRRESK